MKRSIPPDLDPDTGENDYQIVKKRKITETKNAQAILKQKVKDIYQAVIDIADENNLSSGEKAMAVYLASMVYATLLEHSYPHDAALSFALEIPKNIDQLIITANKITENDDFSIQNILKMINYVATGLTQALVEKMVNADFNLKNKLTSQVRHALVYLTTLHGKGLFLEWLIPSNGLDKVNISGGDAFNQLIIPPVNTLGTISETLSHQGDYVPSNVTNYTSTQAYAENPLSIVYANQSFWPKTWGNPEHVEPAFNWGMLSQNQVPSPIPVNYPNNSLLANITDQTLTTSLIGVIQSLAQESMKILSDPKYTRILNLMDPYTLQRTVILPYDVPLFYYITQKDPSPIIQQMYGTDTNPDGKTIKQYFKDKWLQFLKHSKTAKNWLGKPDAIEKLNPNIKSILEYLFSDADINVMTIGDLDFANSLVNHTRTMGVKSLKDELDIGSLNGNPVAIVQDINNAAKELAARNFKVKNNTVFVGPPEDQRTADELAKLLMHAPRSTQIPQTVDNIFAEEKHVEEILGKLNQKLDEYNYYRDKNLTINSHNTPMDGNIRRLKKYIEKGKNYLCAIKGVYEDHQKRYGVDLSQPIAIFPLNLRQQIQKFYPNFRLMFFNEGLSIPDAIKLLDKSLLRYVDDKRVGKIQDLGKVVELQIPYEEILALFSNVTTDEIKDYFNDVIDNYQPLEATQEAQKRFPLVNALYDNEPETFTSTTLDSIKSFLLNLINLKEDPKPKEFKTWLIVPDDLYWYIKQIMVKDPGIPQKDFMLEKLHETTPFPFGRILSVSSAEKLEKTLEQKLTDAEKQKLLQNYISPIEVYNELEDGGYEPVDPEIDDKSKIPAVVNEILNFPSRLKGRFPKNMQHNYWINYLVDQIPSLASRGQEDDDEIMLQKNMVKPFMREGNLQDKTLFTVNETLGNPIQQNPVDQYIEKLFQDGKAERIGDITPRTLYESVTKFFGDTSKEKQKLADAIEELSGLQTDPTKKDEYFRLSKAILKGSTNIFQGAALSLLEQYLIDHPIMAKTPFGRKVLEAAKDYRSSDPNLDLVDKVLANMNVWWKTLNPITVGILLAAFQLIKVLIKAAGTVAWNVAGAPTVQTLTEQSIQNSPYLASKFEQAYRMRHKDATKEEVDEAFKKWATFGGEQLVQAIPQVANATMAAASSLMDSLSGYPDLQRQQYLLNAQMATKIGNIGYHTIKTALHPNINNIGALSRTLTEGMKFLSTSGKNTPRREIKIPQISIPIKPYQLSKVEEKKPAIPDFPSVSNVSAGPHSRSKGLRTRLQPIVRRQQAPQSKVPVVTMRPLSKLRVYLKPSSLPIKTRNKIIRTKPLKATRPLLRKK